MSEGDAMARIATISRKMPDLRKTVQRELKRQKWSAYKLVQELKGKRANGKNVPPAIIYAFLRGETTLNSDDLGLIFDALGLKVSGE